MAGMMTSFLSSNFLEGQKINSMSPEDGAAATLEAGVTSIQSPGWKSAPTSSATPMQLPGGVSPIMSSTASPIKVQKAEPIEIVSAKALANEQEAQQEAAAVAAVDASKKKRNQLLLAGGAAVGLYLLMSN